MPKLHKKRALPTGKVIVACMRDEALFVVEWVAHHLALGFDRIIVFTNDCSDGTDALLKAMAAALPVEHYDNPGPYTAGTIQKRWRWPLICLRCGRPNGCCTLMPMNI